MKKFEVKVLLKCKNKKKFVHIFCSLSWSSLILIRGSYLNKKLPNPNLVNASQNALLTIPHGFRQFWQHLSCNFEKKLFLSGVIVSVNSQRKDIKVIFVSFRFRAGRFTVECKEYGSTLFSYLDIFMYFSWNLLWIQGLQSICSVT